MPIPQDTVQEHSRRIEAIDIARGVALVAMAIYHFAWDLEFFGYVDPGTIGNGGWKLFARCIASSFLFLVGFSLFLAHARQIRWRGFWQRLAMVAVAAAAISAVTYVATPGGFIFFGILHQIALASLLGLAFLRLPAVVNLIIAAVIIATPFLLYSPIFDAPGWLWLGLSETRPRSNDYVPLFPWFGAVLVGMAAARFSRDSGLLNRLAALRPGKWSRPLIFAGRHSLAFYLIHQPVLIGCVWLFSQVFPVPAENREVSFLRSCQATCQNSREEDFCARYCACMIEGLQKDGSFDQLFSTAQTSELREQVEQHALACTGRTEYNLPEGGTP